MTIIDNTNGSSTAVSNGIAMANSGLVNFSTVSSDGSVRLALLQVEAYNASDDKSGKGSSAAGAYTFPKFPDQNGNGIPEVYINPDRIPRGSAGAVAVFHEVLHHDANIDALVNSAINSAGFASLSADEKNYARLLIEEKALRDTVMAVSMLNTNFASDWYNVNDIDKIFDAYSKYPGTETPLDAATRTAVLNYLASGYDPIDIVVNGQSVTVSKSGGNVSVTPGEAAEGITDPNTGVTTEGTSQVVRSGVEQVLHDIGAAIKGVFDAVGQVFVALGQMLDDIFSGNSGTSGNAVADHVNSGSDNQGQDNAKPVILDLDGDGVEINVNGNVSFDIDGDGYLEKTAWASADDGFLVIDLMEGGARSSGTGDGKITEIEELILSKWVEGGVATDLQALATFDSVASRGGNNDGVLNSLDTIWDKLKIWQDANQNGVVDAGEMKTLSSLGITQINLGYDSGAEFSNLDDDVSYEGTSLLGVASFVRNGQTVVGGVGDVSLAYDAEGWRRVDTYDVAGNVTGYEIQFESGAKLRYATLADNLVATDARNNVNLDTEVLDGATGNSNANNLDAFGHTRVVQISGSAGDDTIAGGANDDMLSGDSGADQIRGWDGNDVIFIDKADLGPTGIVLGGQGVDTIVVTGTEAVNFLLSTLEAEVAIGGDGGDTISGVGLTEELSIRGGANNDRLIGGDGDDDLSGEVGDDSVFGGNGDDEIFGGDGNDSLVGNDGDDFIMGGGSADIIYGSSGDDEIYGSEGNDDLYGGNADDVLYGGEGNNTLNGGYGDDQLYGGTGADTLRYWNGDDTLAGSDGNDTFIAKTDDQYGDGSEWGWAVFEGGAGFDTVQLAGGRSQYQIVYVSGNQWQINRYVSPSERVTIDLVDIEKLEFNDGVSVFLSTNSTVDTSDGYVRANKFNEYVGDSVASMSSANYVINGTLFGWMGDDNLSGSSTGNVVEGGTGQDTISGSYGNDTLSGNSGTDAIFGGADSDTINGGSGADQISGGDGTDTVSGGYGDDSLWGDAGNDSVYGDGGSDILSVGDGNDRAFGGDGSDKLSGGLGSDSLVGDIGADSLFGDGGNDVLDGGASADFLFGGTGDDQAFGGDGANMISGDDGNDSLVGGVGDDQISGGAGIDSLWGGVGRDNLMGGAGADFLDGGDGQLDLLSYETSSVGVNIDLKLGTAYGGDAAGDQIYGFEQILGSAHSDTLWGSDVDNVLFGADGDDTIFGQAGHDDMFGGRGNDQIHGVSGLDRIWGEEGADTLWAGGGQDTLYGGDGYDYVSYAEAASAVTVDLLTTRNNAGEALGDVIGQVEGIVGSNFGDILRGNGGSNGLFGGSGDDTLEGRFGAADTLDGGVGIDIASYSTSTSAVVVSLGSPATNSSAALGDVYVNIEGLEGSAFNDQLNGDAGGNGLSGGSGNDTIFGNGGMDTLDGQAANDSLVGGGGSDTYIVDSLTDVVVELTGEGSDAVFSVISYTIGANVEDLTLTGTTAIDGTGNSLANNLSGNGAANSLSGLGANDILLGLNGADTLAGGTGNDTLQGGGQSDSLNGGAGADHFVFASTTNGVDVIADFNELDGGGEEGDVLEFQGLLVGVFVYRGTSSFTGGSDNSEARISGSQVLIDTDGDATTDITITLTGLTAATQLAASDFLFI